MTQLPQTPQSILDNSQDPNNPDHAAKKLKGVVEWSKGEEQRFVWIDGRIQPYRVEPWAAPVNYGCLPDTFNPADGAEIDAVWLGEKRAVGDVVEAVPSGLLHLRDGDHKVIFGALDEPSAQTLLEWFPAKRGATLFSAAHVWTWMQSLHRDDT